VATIVLEKRPECTCNLFEPVPRYFDYCIGRFAGKKKVHMENLTLEDKTGEFDSLCGWAEHWTEHSHLRKND